MDAARFRQFRRGHRALVRALERLEASAGGERMVPVVGRFLERDAPALEQWLRREEAEIFSALDAWLPLETEASLALRREHDTACSLLLLLRRAHEAVRRGEPWADVQLVSAAQDLSLLLRDHFRKEDGVVSRLLSSLMAEGRHD